MEDLIYFIKREYDKLLYQKFFIQNKTKNLFMLQFYFPLNVS